MTLHFQVSASQIELSFAPERISQASPSVPLHDAGKRIRAGLRCFSIFLRSTAAYADRAEDVAIDYKRNASLDGHRVREFENWGVAVLGDGFLKHFGRPLEEDCAARLFPGYFETAQLRIVHPFHIHQVAAIVHDENKHVVMVGCG